VSSNANTGRSSRKFSSCAGDDGRISGLRSPPSPNRGATGGHGWLFPRSEITTRSFELLEGGSTWSNGLTLAIFDSQQERLARAAKYAKTHPRTTFESGAQKQQGASILAAAADGRDSQGARRERRFGDRGLPERRIAAAGMPEAVHPAGRNASCTRFERMGDANAESAD